MKQENVLVSMEEEKLTALRRYMAKRECKPEDELAEALKKLYEKYVPAPVREYIDENDAQSPYVKIRPPRKPRVQDENTSLVEVTSDGE